MNVFATPIPPPPTPRSGDAGKARPQITALTQSKCLSWSETAENSNFLSAFRGKNQYILPANVQFHVFSRASTKYFIEAAVYSIIWLIIV